MLSLFNAVESHLCNALERALPEDIKWLTVEEKINRLNHDNSLNEKVLETLAQSYEPELKIAVLCHQNVSKSTIATLQKDILHHDEI